MVASANVSIVLQENAISQREDRWMLLLHNASSEEDQIVKSEAGANRPSQAQEPITGLLYPSVYYITQFKD